MSLGKLLNPLCALVSHLSNEDIKSNYVVGLVPPQRGAVGLRETMQEENLIQCLAMQ